MPAEYSEKRKYNNVNCKISRIVRAYVFGNGIKTTGSLVKHQNGSVLENGSGNGYTLLFSTRQFKTTLANLIKLYYNYTKNAVVFFLFTCVLYPFGQVIIES